MTPSAISQQVSGLEDHLGVKLFDRVKQRIHLTDAGNSYRLSLVAAFDRIESATVDLIGHGGGEPLRVGALPSLANYWLIPRLRRFGLQHPTVMLQVVSLDLDFASTERSPDLEGGRLDIGLFYSDGHWPHLVAEKLMDEHLVAVAARPPHGEDQIPETKLIEELPLLQHSTRPESWASWFQQQNQRPRTPRGPSFEHFHMLVEAAKAGLGVALVPEAFVQSELRTQTLVRISPFAPVRRPRVLPGVRPLQSTEARGQLLPRLAAPRSRDGVAARRSRLRSSDGAPGEAHADHHPRTTSRSNATLGFHTDIDRPSTSGRTNR